MGRPQRPIDPYNSPLEAFAWQLRLLRAKTGNPTYRQMAQRCGFSASALSAAAAGLAAPSRQVTLAYVEACGGDGAEWAERWAVLHASQAVRALPAAAAQPGSRDDAPRRPNRAAATTTTASTATTTAAATTAAPGPRRSVRHSVGVVASGVALVVVSDIFTEQLGTLSTCVVAAVAAAASTAALRVRK